MNWTVDEALGEVATAIAAGAEPLVVDQETRESLKALFEGDFKNQLASGARWLEDKERVLPLARRIGRRAKLLTLDQLALTPGRSQATESVDYEAALRAAYYVCKTYQIAGRKAGPYCPGVPAPSVAVAHGVLDDLLGRIRQSGNEV